MGQIVVGATELKNKIEELRALNGQFKSATGELENTEGTLNGMWEGSAKDAFHIPDVCKHQEYVHYVPITIFRLL